MSDETTQPENVLFTADLNKPKLSEYLIVAHYQGSNNSMPVSGFKTMTMGGPGFKNSEDLIEIANVVMQTVFDETHYKDLEVTIINALKLPI